MAARRGAHVDSKIRWSVALSSLARSSLSMRRLGIGVCCGAGTIGRIRRRRAAQARKDVEPFRFDDIFQHFAVIAWLQRGWK